jgi:hypothetical protein
MYSLEKSEVPMNFNDRSDFKYLSTDCFHMSQLGHARAANAYWNSMLTVESERDRKWKKEFEEFKCPTLKHPFLMTTKNS